MTLFINKINSKGCKTYDQDGVYYPGELFSFLDDNLENSEFYQGWFPPDSWILGTNLTVKGAGKMLKRVKTNLRELREKKTFTREFMKGQIELSKWKANEYLAALEDLKQFLQRAAKLRSTIEVWV